MIDCVLMMKTSSARVNVANVVLPTIIVQIDGIINDYLNDNNQQHMGYRARNKHLDKYPIPFDLSHNLDEAAKDVFLNVLFQNADTGAPLANPFYFNRHKILHAEFIKYGKESYLVRAFMLLDILASLK